MPATAKKTPKAPGYRGATVISFDENAPRALVARIMAEYPQAGRDEICRRVRTAVKGPERKYLDAFLDYTTINAYNAIRDGEKAADRLRRKAENRSARDLEDERHAEELRRIEETEKATKAVQTMLLELIAPNGKLWRDLSIAEYMTFGEKQMAHGKRMLKAGHKRAELLSDATTEDELRKVFGGA